MIDPAKLVNIADSAAELLMRYYRESELFIKRKDDNSPVTIADKESSDFIISELKKLTPGIPVVSEESDKEKNIKIVKKHAKFWLIDPLDGTWSFIKKRDSFTINIALIKDGIPIWGLIKSPVHNSTYYIGKDGKAVKLDGKTITKLSVKKVSKSGLDFLVSNQNLDQRLQDFISQYKVRTITPIPGAIKFALLAEGKGDIYPRFRATGIWDTAAGHALLNTVGGEIFDTNGIPLRYNGGNLENPNFIAVASRTTVDFSKISIPISNE